MKYVREDIGELCTYTFMESNSNCADDLVLCRIVVVIGAM